MDPSVSTALFAFSKNFLASPSIRLVTDHALMVAQDVEGMTQLLE